MSDSYILKFCEKKEYCEDLINGKLFCMPIFYYRYLESDKGDLREGSVYHGAQIYKGSCSYVFCASFIGKDNLFVIDKKLSKHFCDKEAYLAILEYRDFEKVLDNELRFCTKGYAFKTVEYKYLGMKTFHETVLPTNWYQHFFYKAPMNRYIQEHEFRIAFVDQSKVELSKYEIKQLVKNNQQVSISKTFVLQSDFKNHAVILNLNEYFKTHKELTLFDIEKLFENKRYYI